VVVTRRASPTATVQLTRHANESSGRPRTRTTEDSVLAALWLSLAPVHAPAPAPAAKTTPPSSPSRPAPPLENSLRWQPARRLDASQVARALSVRVRSGALRVPLPFNPRLRPGGLMDKALDFYAPLFAAACRASSTPRAHAAAHPPPPPSAPCRRTFGGCKPHLDACHGRWAPSSSSVQHAAAPTSITRLCIEPLSHLLCASSVRWEPGAGLCPRRGFDPSEGQRYDA
jgi:hypothetical protein